MKTAFKRIKVCLTAAAFGLVFLMAPQAGPLRRAGRTGGGRCQDRLGQRGYYPGTEMATSPR
jgi:hypothetical protein